MKTISVILLWMLLAVSFTACYDDKGNYDYHDLTSLTLDTAGMNLSNGLTAYQFEEFVFDPKVQWAGDTADIAYLWKMYPQSLPTLPEGVSDYDSSLVTILSRESVLRTVITDVPDLYYLTLEVTDEVSDTKTYLTVNLTVESSLSRGLCVLSEKEDGFDLSIVKDQKLMPDVEESRLGVVHDVVSSVNDGRKIANGKFLGQFTPTTGKGQFIAFTEDGAYLLDGDSYEITSDEFGDLFSFSIGLVGAPQALAAANRYEFLLNNKKLYSFSWSTMGGDRLFGDYEDGDYEAASFLVNTSNTNNPLLMFDEANNKFVPISRFGDINAFENTPSAAFDVNAIDENLQLLWMEQGNNNVTYAIFNDDANSDILMYAADFSGEDPLPQNIYSLSGTCPNIDENSIFAVGSRGGYCFYASGSQVYKYTYQSGTCTEAATFGSETVTAMKVFRRTGHDQDGRLLIVGTYDESTGNGKIYLLTIDVLSGTIDQTGLSEGYTGFGRVKDFMYKE